MKSISVQSSAASSSPWGWTHGVEDRFRPMVEKLQAKAARDPGAYRRRVLGGALLGYLVVFGLLAVLLALIVGCVLPS